MHASKTARMFFVWIEKYLGFLKNEDDFVSKSNKLAQSECFLMFWLIKWFWKKKEVVRWVELVAGRRTYCASPAGMETPAAARSRSAAVRRPRGRRHVFMAVAAAAAA